MHKKMFWKLSVVYQVIAKRPKVTTVILSLCKILIFLQHKHEVSGDWGRGMTPEHRVLSKNIWEILLIKSVI